MKSNDISFYLAIIIFLCIISIFFYPLASPAYTESDRDLYSAAMTHEFHKKGLTVGCVVDDKNGTTLSCAVISGLDSEVDIAKMALSAESTVNNLKSHGFKKVVLTGGKGSRFRQIMNLKSARWYDGWHKD